MTYFSFESEKGSKDLNFSELIECIVVFTNLGSTLPKNCNQIFSLFDHTNIYRDRQNHELQGIE
jgi:hypothetical protein